MHTTIDTVAAALTPGTAWDDVAAGLACATICIATASMFVAIFAGTL